MKTQKDILEKKVSFEEYIEQFANLEHGKVIYYALTHNKEIEPQEVEDLPIKDWDAVAFYGDKNYANIPLGAGQKIIVAGDFLSLSIINSINKASVQLYVNEINR